MKIKFKISMLAALALSACSASAERTGGSLKSGANLLTPALGSGSDASVADSPQGPLLFIAIDAMHPGYLSLDSHGNAGGKDGDWLMPNLHAFLARSTWFPAAKDYLPAATDMNHLNALAGTNSGLTGEIGVSAMVTGWQAPTPGAANNAKWKPVLQQSDLKLLRDDEGRPVDTLFHAMKRSYPELKTAFISGKAWVAEMFRGTGAVDVIVTGENHPDWVTDPVRRSLIDPPGDKDGICKPRSFKQQAFATFLESKPAKFPADAWVVDASLSVFDHENPAMAYILLAQQDDEGHALGAAWNPEEFKQLDRPPFLFPGCSQKPEYRYVSRRNSAVFREPVLAAAREVDRQFGRLIDGLQTRGVLDQATVVLLSDHGMITHLKSTDSAVDKALDLRALLADHGLIGKDNFFPYTATSFGLLYWREGKEQVAAAKKLLEDLRVRNPETGVMECPWYVLDRDDMRAGVPGIALPGELYHRYFVDTDQERTVVWPDLVLLAKNGWQLPTYGGLANNIGITGLPKTGLNLDNMRFSPFLGGHGSLDTEPIVMAFALPQGQGAVVSENTRIADIATTLARRFGLELRSSTIGRDLSSVLR